MYISEKTFMRREVSLIDVVCSFISAKRRVESMTKAENAFSSREIALIFAFKLSLFFQNLLKKFV